MTAEEIRRIEARWKSDVDNKLDTLIRSDEDRALKYDVFIDMMIEREKSRARMRNAVIEKTLIGLLFMALVFIGHAVWGEIKKRLGIQ